MLAHKNRLVKKQDFMRVQKNGQFFAEGSLALKVAANERRATRIGFAVGLNFSKKAATRNHMKRQLREVFRRELSQLAKGLDLVVFARKKEEEKISSQALEKNVRALLQKSRLILKK